MSDKKMVLDANAFICTFTIDPKRRDEFLRVFNGLWTQFVDVMEENTNFVYYGWGRNPNEIYMIESWKSEQVTNKVRADPRFKEALTAMIECCTAPMRLQILSGLRSDRSVFDLYPAGPSEYHPSTDELVTRFE
jgi:quinol monooxygenase YgiN